jgi:hypothetical protein
MALLNTWASQQDQATLSPLDRLLNNYIQKGDAPLAYLMRGDAQGLLKDLNTPKPVNMTQDMANAALNLNPVMGLIGATAYHGSPAIFDKFDINKVGTGQGAQSFGHGIYFAENPAVAKEYQKELSGYQPGVKSLLQQYGDVDKAINEATDKVKHYQNLIKQGGLGLGEERANSLLNISTKQLADLQSVKAGIPENTGAFYKVDIPDQDIPKMLDWDKPISQQDKSIKPAIEAVLNKVKSIGSLFEKPNPDIMTGRDLYNSYTAYRGMNQDFASEGLNELGIKGIKYLDEGSRAAGKGTSNFVVFDPSQVKIIERNNKGLLK